MTGSRALAAIDVGTNSVHMVIARPVPGGSPEILARERMPVRLGRGGRSGPQQAVMDGFGPLVDAGRVMLLRR